MLIIITPLNVFEEKEFWGNIFPNSRHILVGIFGFMSIFGAVTQHINKRGFNKGMAMDIYK